MESSGPRLDREANGALRDGSGRWILEKEMSTVRRVSDIENRRQIRLFRSTCVSTQITFGRILLMSLKYVQQSIRMCYIMSNLSEQIAVAAQYHHFKELSASQPQHGRP